MTEIKKTIENPPSRLKKRIIALSESNDWSKSRKEWRMVAYYYATGYHSCLCSPRGIHNITVKIESVVRRLKADIDLSMDETCLDYLLKHRVIDDVEYKDYQLIRLARVNDYVRSFRQKINNRLIIFTD